ncbi:MAG TPA: hypothetical protein VGW12_02925 [Pyrinomonadaceae bacterium]|nr:hypothetical protein [Pyrinomonadaceae bacterium]
MKSQKKKKKNTSRVARRKQNERGAAMIMMLLVSMLLLAAGGALIMTTALTTTTVYESTPETLAYYAAETGIEDTLNVLRGNGQASAAPACPGGAMPDPEKISFRRALTRCTSNLAGDSQAATFPLRLSRWLNYNYQPPNLTYPDRVAITPGYSPLNGTAYSVALRDPDNSQVVSYSVTGRFNNGLLSTGLFGGGLNTANLTYTPPAPVTTNANPSVPVSLGTIRAQYSLPVNVNIPLDTTLTITINQIRPWPATYTIVNRLTGVIAPGAANTAKILYGEQSVVFGGTTMQLPGSLDLISGLIGSAAGNNQLNATLTAPEPRKLVVTSTGYGPRGARKFIEATLDNFNFGIRPPAPICIRGSDNVAQSMTFELGNSNAKAYIGVDAAGQQPTAPAVAITLHDWTAANNGISKGSTVQPSPPASPDDHKLAILDHTIPASMMADPNPVPQPWAAPSPIPVRPPPQAVTPDFLRTADAAREFLYGANGNGGLRAKARSQGRYFDAPFSGTAGNYNTGGFTFVDNNCELDGGGGLLVVTGDLELNGNSEFRGIILVMGNGRVTRKGGGNADIRGAWIVANFNRNGPGGFGAPTFDVSGGGNSNFQFDWAAIVGANRAVGLSLIGIAER